MIDDRLSSPLSSRDSISVLYSGIVLVRAISQGFTVFLPESAEKPWNLTVPRLSARSFPLLFMVEISGIEPLTS